MTTIEVKLHEARDLPDNVSRAGFNCPFAMISVGGITHRTPVAVDTRSIRWQPPLEFSFPVEGGGVTGPEPELRVEFCNNDPQGRGRMGKRALAVKMDSLPCEVWVPLLMLNDAKQWVEPSGTKSVVHMSLSSASPTTAVSTPALTLTDGPAALPPVVPTMSAPARTRTIAADATLTYTLPAPNPPPAQAQK
eukprot:gene3561-4007_t